MSPSPLRGATVLRAQAEALTAAAARLDEEAMERAIAMLVACRSKVVVSGVGKSGIVARKIASTFNSVGALALHLSPLAAVHGDLGVLRGGDVAILVSNGGETGELLTLLPHLRRHGIEIIAITGRTRSTLARASAAVLDAGVEREVGPLPPLPTSSTAVATAIGDALALMWADRAGISAAQFARYHPGGLLGRGLNLSVRDVMVPVARLPALPAGASLVDALEHLTGEYAGVAWVNLPRAPNRLAGIVTDGDLRRVMRSTEPRTWAALRVRDFMTPDPICIEAAAKALEALHLMEHNRRKPVTALPVVDEDGRVEGLVRLHDLVKAGIG